MRHLLTGATSGIGAAVAVRLHDRGDDLVVLTRDPERAAGLPGAEVLVADLADPASVAATTIEGPLDSVVHCAGMIALGPVAELGPTEWTRQLTVNLVAPALLTRACLPALRETRGTVLFVNSGAGRAAHPHWSGYAASKFGLRALADALRGEEPDLRVTTIYPGRTATPMQAEVHRHEGRAYDPDAWIRPETVADAILGVLDLGRDATMPEIVISPGR